MGIGPMTQQLLSVSTYPLVEVEERGKHNTIKVIPYKPAVCG